MRVVNFRAVKYLILLFLSSLSAVAQDSIPHRFAITAGYQRGFLIAHRPMVIPLQQDKVNGFELSLSIHPNGSKDWHHIYGFAEPGISVSVWDIGNSEQIGKVFTLIPYMDFPLVKGKKSSFDLKFGWGIGYVQKKFDAVDNYKNVAIGSKLNFGLILNPHYKIHISDAIALSAGISMTHYSNGSIETPNLGLNVASIGGGISYNIGRPLTVQQKILPKFERSSRNILFIAASSKQTYPADGRNHLVATFAGNRMWQISRKSAFGLGFDLFYDHSTYQRAEDQNITINSDWEALRGGIHGSYEMVIEDLSFIVDLGAYVYSKLDDGALHQRVGLRYKINEHISACMHLKAHWGKADFAEFGLGYSFGKMR